jgi:putative alpha-1,2-mannosidase
MLTPTKYSEHGGLYHGRDNQLYSTTITRANMTDVFGALSLEQFSDLSLWDTFRTAHPWMLLTRPDIAVAVLRSMADMVHQKPHMPVWMLANIESGCMIGMLSVAVFAESLYAGLASTYDLAAVQKVAVADASDSTTSGRRDIAFYLANGYVSLQADEHSAPLTLTYAFDDHSVGVLSEFVGDATAANASYTRGLNYRNIWSPDREIMCPRNADGSMACPKKNTLSWNYYVEGDAEHWRWFVPHDVEGLMGLFSSKDEFELVLRNFFDEHVKYWEKDGEFLPNPCKK